MLAHSFVVTSSNISFWLLSQGKLSIIDLIYSSLEIIDISWADSVVHIQLIEGGHWPGINCVHQPGKPVKHHGSKSDAVIGKLIFSLPQQLYTYLGDWLINGYEFSFGISTKPYQTHMT